VLVAAVLVAAAHLPARSSASPPWPHDQPASFDGATLADAQRLFYNANYGAAAELASTLHASDPQNLAIYELCTASLHFQIRDALGNAPDKSKAFTQCLSCPVLLKAFVSDTARGQAIARERVRINPTDDEALFFLGKLDLNYVWLHLETLGRKTGWKEYWEARKSLDAALLQNPSNVRARVSRAWVDYIVGTKMSMGTRWILGGGSKKQAFILAREAASAEAEFFVHAEAEFALWEMLVRDRNLTEATTVARRLARDFPSNRKLITFLTANDPSFTLASE
jgi:hypothetical protein